MCDYSLHHVMSTPAKVGDVLKTTSFSGSSTRGFCAAGEPNVAVCVMPGTELAFASEIECDRAIGFLPHRRLFVGELQPIHKTNRQPRAGVTRPDAGIMRGKPGG